MNTLAKYLLAGLMLLAFGFTKAQTLVKGEYFIDTDPGVGMASSIPFTPDSVIDISFNADLTGLTNGQHALYIRFQDDSGRWGNTVRSTFISTSSSLSVTPNVVQCEYFFNTDPGIGLGTPISLSPDSIVDYTYNLDLSTVSAGMNVSYLRCKDATGAWSNTVSKPILINNNSLSTLGNINRIEYYYDTDPGYGMAIPTSFSADSIVDLQTLLDASGLTPGLHLLNLRAQDANGSWSHNMVRPFIVAGSMQTPMLTRIEYFFDADPGAGNGTAIMVSSDTLLDVLNTFDLSALSPGFHIAYIRSGDEFGAWSTTNSIPFIHLGNNLSPVLTHFEYFFDTDPGVGLGIQADINPDTSMSDMNLTFNLNGLNQGLHIAYVRGFDNNGHTGTTHSYPFIKINQSNKQVIKAEYAIDNDPGVGSAITVNIPADSLADFNFPANLDTVSQGFHILYLRTMDNDSGWSQTIIRPFLSVKNNTASNVSAFRFYVDSVDIANYQQIDVTPDTLFDNTLTANLTGVSKGLHQLYVIALNENQSWSVAYMDTICVGPLANFAVDTVCLRQNSVVTNLTVDADGSTQYAWDINGDGITDNTSSVIAPLYSTPGTYPIRLIVNNSGLCPDTALISAFVRDLPYPIITSNTGKLGFCIEDSLILTTGTFSSYSWSTGSTSAQTVISSSGTFYLTVSDTNNCFNTDTVIIPVLQRPLVEGIVKYDSLGTQFNVTKGSVQIYYSDTLGNLSPLTTANINANGTYTFGIVPIGNVTLFSVPDSALYYPDLGAMYYNGATVWDSVPTMTIGCEDTLYQTIIHPYFKPLSGGTNLISGRVVTGVGPRKPGEPVRGAGIYVEQIPGGNQAYRVSNGSGDFKFDLLPAGKYRLMVNVPGKRLDSTYTFDILPGATVKDTDNVFFINDTLIYIEDTYLTVDSVFKADTTGNESVLEYNLLKNILVYPNPVRDESRILIENSSLIKDFSIQILTLSGQQVFTTAVSNLEPGNHMVKLNRNRFEAAGIYLLRYGGDHKRTMKILIE